MMSIKKNGHMVMEVVMPYVIPVGLWSGDKYECPVCKASVVMCCGDSIASGEGTKEVALEYIRAGDSVDIFSR